MGWVNLDLWVIDCLTLNLTMNFDLDLLNENKPKIKLRFF